MSESAAISRPGFSVSNPYVDPPEARLPEPARAKLAQLRQHRTDLAALVQSANRDQHAARDKLDDVARSRTWLEAQGPVAFNQRAAAKPHRAAEEARIAREDAQVKSEIKRLRAILDERQEAFSAANVLLQNVERWIGELSPGRPIKLVLAPAALPKSADPKVVLEKVRLHIAGLGADRHAVESAPKPSATARAAARAHIERLATAGAPDVGRLLDGAEEFAWPQQMRRVGTEYFHEPDMPALLAWLFRDQILAKVNAEIDELADDGSALSDEDRAAKLLAIAADLLEAERQEEALVEIIGPAAIRRRDCDPRAMLGVDGPPLQEI